MGWGVQLLDFLGGEICETLVLRLWLRGAGLSAIGVELFVLAVRKAVAGLVSAAVCRYWHLSALALEYVLAATFHSLWVGHLVSNVKKRLQDPQTA